MQLAFGASDSLIALPDFKASEDATSLLDFNRFCNKLSSMLGWAWICATFLAGFVVGRWTGSRQSPASPQEDAVAVALTRVEPTASQVSSGDECLIHSRIVRPRHPSLPREGSELAKFYEMCHKTCSCWYVTSPLLWLLMTWQLDTSAINSSISGAHLLRSCIRPACDV